MLNFQVIFGVNNLISEQPCESCVTTLRVLCISSLIIKPTPLYHTDAHVLSITVRLNFELCPEKLISLHEMTKSKYRSVSILVYLPFFRSDRPQLFEKYLFQSQGLITLTLKYLNSIRTKQLKDQQTLFSLY